MLHYHLMQEWASCVCIRKSEGWHMAFEIPKHYISLDKALAEVFGNRAAVAQADKVLGGDINQAYGLTLTDGTHVFLKTN